MKLFGNVILRVIATFVASALGVIGAGSVAGSVSGVEIPIWFSAIMGGIMAVAKVVELLSLTKDEINAAFRQTTKLKDTDEVIPTKKKEKE
jgi:hypothetical protein